MWPQNSAVFQCSGQEAGSFLELFQNKRKKLSLFPEVLRRVHRSWGNRAPLPWQHTAGPASHLRKAPSPVCLCRLPGAGQRWGWGCFSLTCRFASCALRVLLWSYLLIVSLFLLSTFFWLYVLQITFVLSGHKYIWLFLSYSCSGRKIQ